MNLLDPVLRTANSGAVLATFKCFITLTNSMPELHPQIYARAKPPILTLVSTRDDHYTTIAMTTMMLMLMLIEDIKSCL
jgi:F0F1-type ATP synthase membrane subunit a